MQLIWADAAYADQLIDRIKVTCDWVLEIVRLKDNVEGFQVFPHRIGSRTYICMAARYRRLSKDYEGLTESG